jgi:ATP-binding cassette subfamily C (CFTR/MRP) protein 1
MDKYQMLTLSRFSQDLKLVDQDLPASVSAFATRKSYLLIELTRLIQSGNFKLVMQASLLFAAQKLLIFTFPITAAIVYVIQKFYLRASRHLRLIELESQAAVYSSFLETVSDITVVSRMRI